MASLLPGDWYVWAGCTTAAANIQLPGTIAAVGDGWLLKAAGAFLEPARKILIERATLGHPCSRQRGHQREERLPPRRKERVFRRDTSTLAVTPCAADKLLEQRLFVTTTGKTATRKAREPIDTAVLCTCCMKPVQNPRAPAANAASALSIVCSFSLGQLVLCSEKPLLRVRRKA